MKSVSPNMDTFMISREKLQILALETVDKKRSH